MNPIRLPSHARVLVVVLRRLGDVLLATPLIRSVKRAFPDASIEALVFAGTEGILAGNPDLARVIAIPPRPSASESLALLRRLRRRYDLAISTQTGDRPTTLACVAGRQSAGLLEPAGLSSAIKRFVLSRSCPSDRHLHRVLDNLSLAAALGIPAITEVVGPAGVPPASEMPVQPCAVVHAAPMFRFKRWAIDGWRALATALRERGLSIAVTGANADRDYLDEVWSGCEVTRLDGSTDWPALAALIRAARVYVGPDTAVTHLAAATGTPTVALFGPTDPRIWGPWPVGGLERPWAAAGTIQRRGNVWLVQNPLPCLPCQLEGCDRHINSRSQCLDELSASQVLSAVEQALMMEQAV